MTVQDNNIFETLPNELGLTVFSYLDQKSLAACSSVSSQFNRLVEDLALTRLFRYLGLQKPDSIESLGANVKKATNQLGFPEEAPMWKTCVRLKQLARGCGIEAKGKTLEALVDELKEKADKIKGMDDRKAYFKLLVNNYMVEYIEFFNDPKYADRLSNLLPNMITKGLTADQIFLMAEDEKKLYLIKNFYNFRILTDINNPMHFLSDPDLKVLLQSVIANFQFNRVELSQISLCYETLLKGLLAYKNKVNGEQKKSLDEVIVSLIEAIDNAKEEAKKQYEGHEQYEGQEQHIESSFKLGQYSFKMLQNEYKLSPEVTLKLLEAGEDIGKDEIIELAKKYPENKIVVNKAKDIKNAKLKNIIKVIVEVAAFAFVVIGNGVLSLTYPGATAVFAAISFIAMYVTDSLLWEDYSRIF